MSSVPVCQMERSHGAQQSSPGSSEQRVCHSDGGESPRSDSLFKIEVISSLESILVILESRQPLYFLTES